MSTVIATNYEEAKNLSAILLSYNPVVLGFDTETTVGREENPHYTSTVQLSIISDSQDPICYIFQIYRIYRETQKLPKDLIKILQNPNIVKIGVDLTNDIINLASYG